MPQLLLEFFSEEIPARMQKRAEEDLARALKEKLAAHGLQAGAVATFSSPRRIGAVIEDLPAKAADVNEEKKGPRVGAPEQAVAGFLKSAGLARIEDAQVVEDKKGAFYVARIERAGRATSAILAEIVPEIIRAFPWPKSMRSGTSDLTWVRPLQNILCLFDGAAVKIDVDGAPSEAKTWGHRFHAAGAITVKNATEHAAKLRAAHVLIDREERKRIILEGAKAACAARGLELVEDAGLLEEVAGLVEWPVVLLGDMDARFLDLPGEVIRLSMRTHQKFFAVRWPKDSKEHGKLAPHFVTVANIEAKDGGAAIAAGNARVLSARLNDARFFWDADKKTPLFTEERKAKLQKIVFHQKLGSVWDKVERVKALARELAPLVYGPPASPPASAAHAGETPAVHIAQRQFATLEHFIAAVERAAELCKMDLVTETVGEFPELQGQIGRQLYLAQLSAPSPLVGEGREGGRSDKLTSAAASRPPSLTPPRKGEGDSVAQAIEDHYRPLGPNDRVPSDPVAVMLALADKLDTLVGFWAIDEKPTGSSDPYALRRAALGFVRTILQNNVRFDGATNRGLVDYLLRAWSPQFNEHLRSVPTRGVASEDLRARETQRLAILIDLFLFIGDRLKVQLRDQGKRHDLVDAVFDESGGENADDDLVRIVARVEALDVFLKTPDGANLLAGYKRAANILAAEEKKGKWSAGEAKGAVEAKLLAEPTEKALFAALETALPAARAAVEKEDFAAAMKALSSLRAPVDEFFEKVLVNAPDEALRRNRLLLLSRLVEALSAVADFSKIEG